MTYTASQQQKQKYLTDPVYREQKKRQARLRYRRLKRQRIRKLAGLIIGS